MELFEALLTRRSIRKFTSQPVSEDQIQKILQAAMYAPSGNNTQPWQFVVITERALLNEIPSIHPYAEMARQATLAIVVCGDGSIQASEPRWSISCSTATQNLLLAVHGLGLAGVWCGLYPDPKRQEGFIPMLNLPDYIHPFSLVCIGYPDETPDPGQRFKPERIHYNHW